MRIKIFQISLKILILNLFYIMSKILKSDSLTSEIYDSIKYKLKSSGKKPGLAIIVVGDRSDSDLYI